VYTRRKKNKTGSTSIHLVQKINGKQVHLKTLGFACDQAALKKLEATARDQIALLSKQNTLPFSYPEDEKHIAQLRASIQSIEPSVCIQLLEQLFNQIGFDKIGDALFKHLVIMRLLYPVSKLKTVEYLARLYRIHYDIDAVYRYMDKLHADHQEQLEQISFDHTKGLLGDRLSVVFYDVTTLYFETEAEDDLRKMGFSKDGKAQNPQIVLGLLVSAGGYPLAYEMFDGNTFEGKTMMPVIESFKNRYGLTRLVIIADAGLLSNQTIKQLIAGQYEFVLGARIKNETEDIKKQILASGLNDGQSMVIEKDHSLKLIISYAKSRADKDQYNRTRGLQKLQTLLNSGKLSKKHINNRGYNKYLKLEGEITLSIDHDKFEQDRHWDGLKGYLTNTSQPKQTVIDHYKNLWQIEKAFRISKTDLRVRPIYHRRRTRIKSHLNIAFCSYKLYKELERQLKIRNVSLSTEKAIEVMKSIYSVNTILPASGKQTSIIIAQEDQQKILLDAFEIKY